MSDVAIVVPCVIVSILGALGIGGIIYVLVKCYIKSKLRKQK